jgi:hypothetical protein
LHGLIGLGLRPQVDAEDIVAWGRGLGAYRADDDEAGDAGLGGGVEELDRPVAVQGELTLGPAARTRAGCEDRRVGAGDRVGDLLDRRLLEIADDGRRAPAADIATLVRIPDQADHLVTTFSKQTRQPQCDLPVGSGNRHDHRPSLP